MSFNHEGKWWKIDHFWCIYRYAITIQLLNLEQWWVMYSDSVPETGPPSIYGSAGWMRILTNDSQTHIKVDETWCTTSYSRGKVEWAGRGAGGSVKNDIVTTRPQSFLIFDLHLTSVVSVHLIVGYEGHTWWVYLVKNMMYFVNISHDPVNSNPKFTTSCRDPPAKTCIQDCDKICFWNPKWGIHLR